MLIVNKPFGAEGTQIANSYKKLYNKKKVVICGKLDPMASGELLLLFDNECKMMNSYLDKYKIYRWKIVWGISTDTSDPLGLITDTIDITIDEDKIIEELQKFVSNQSHQIFHKYSAICLTNKDGERKPLWRWTKENRLDEIIIPKKAVDVKYIKMLNTEVVEDITLKKYILSNLEKISGDFRQEEIKEMWKKFKKKKIFISELEGHVSSGYYIRQFVEDFGKQLGYLGMALDITRIKIVI
jgi:tRNA pseudouridine(55) synthase